MSVKCKSILNRKKYLSNIHVNKFFSAVINYYCYVVETESIL